MQMRLSKSWKITNSKTTTNEREATLFIDRVTPIRKIRKMNTYNYSGKDITFYRKDTTLYEHTLFKKKTQLFVGINK